MISIIVPIYNVKDYLCECIDSILNQTYTDLEILLVDDGSTDGSGEICDRYKTLDSRIQVLHKKNGGLADARNAGIKIATGRYIGFVDSDDYIHPRMYELLYDSCERNQAEIAMCKFQTFENTVVECKYVRQASKCFTRDEILSAYINENTKELITPSVWSKLFRRDCIEGLEFPIGKLCEDIVFTAKAFYNANKVIYLEMELYYYRQRAGSIMSDSSVLVRRIREELEQYVDRLSFIQETGNRELVQGCQYALYNRIFLRYCDITDDILRENKEARMLKRQLEAQMQDLHKEAKRYYLKVRKQYTLFQNLRIWLGLEIPSSYRYIKLGLNWKTRKG